MTACVSWSTVWPRTTGAVAVGGAARRGRLDDGAPTCVSRAGTSRAFLWGGPASGERPAAAASRLASGAPNLNRFGEGSAVREGCRRTPAGADCADGDAVAAGRLPLSGSAISSMSASSEPPWPKGSCPRNGSSSGPTSRSRVGPAPGTWSRVAGGDGGSSSSRARQTPRASTWSPPTAQSPSGGGARVAPRECNARGAMRPGRGA